MKLSADNHFPPITELIPHRPPVVLIDRVISCDGANTKTQYRIPEEGFFVENGTFGEMGLIENMAQSSFIFLHYLKDRGIDPNFARNGTSIGYISNIVQLEILGLARSGQILNTSLYTELVFTSENLKICKVTGQISVENEVVFNATMTMLLQTKEA
jgi:3-hydroxymyristoyl/3-hydroxydecanoyl-(acyl carrier protein) dehydratase